MPNVHRIVSGHNKTILNKRNKTETTKNQRTEKSSECNCRKKDSCPLPSKCLTSSIVYQATVTRNDTKEEKTYVGHCRRVTQNKVQWIHQFLQKLQIQTCY